MKSIQHIVLLHGWGCDSRSWQSILPFLETQANTQTIDIAYRVEGDQPRAYQDDDRVVQRDIDVLVDNIAAQIPNNSVLCGWSLGGMLAARIAACYPEKVIGLITLASNEVFVANQSWPMAMASATFKQFSDSFDANPKQALKRFKVLEVHGDEQAKEQLHYLQSLPMDLDKSHIVEDLRQGLVLLSNIDNTHYLPKIACSALYCFGEKDVLVPERLVDTLNNCIYPNQRAVLIKGAGHLLHYPESRLKGLLVEFFAEINNKQQGEQRD